MDESSCIMLLPDLEYTKSRPHITDHHLTVAYYGREAHTLEATARLHAMVSLISTQTRGPIPARANGIGMFDAGPDGIAMVDLIDGIGPLKVRSICEDYNGLDGATIDYTHGFTPHITREYVQDPGTGIQASEIDGLAFHFTRVGLWQGARRYEVSL